MVRSTAIAWLFLNAATAVSGLPDGAPFCLVGQPSFDSIHLTPPGPYPGRIAVTNGTIAGGGFEVLINNVVLDPSATHTIFTDTTYNVTVKGMGNQQFKGFQLILASGLTDLKFSMLATAADLLYRTAEPSLGCEKLPHASVSHSEPSLKRTTSSTLRLTTVQPSLTLDVNIVVVLNLDQASTYYYSQYKLAAVALPPSNAPTKPPTKAPTKAPTSGLFGLGIFCPTRRCGVLGRLLSLCQTD